MKTILEAINEAKLAEVGFRSEVCGKEIAAECLRVANRVLFDESVAQHGLVISGAVGIGKTLFAEAILRQVSGSYGLIELGGHSAAIAFTDEDRYYSLFDGNLLIDDIGCEPCYNDFGMKREHVAELVSDWWSRYHERRYAQLLVATTNLTFEELDARYGARFMSRLADLCLFWNMPGEDRRKLVYA